MKIYVITFDLEGKREKLLELQNKISSPGFWDDQEEAQRISEKFSEVKGEVGRLKAIEDILEESFVLKELLSEEENEELLEELILKLQKISKDIQSLEESTLFFGEHDDYNAIVTMHAGAGGTESQDWAEMLLRMYLMWSERRGMKVQMNEASAGEEAGIKSATFTVIGKNAYGLLISERGVHRLVRISPFDASKRRHTSFASVEVMPEIKDEVSVEIDEKDLRVETYRATGAGGQHVNKTDSAVRITHIPTGVVAQCQNERSQLSNRQTALKILKSRLLEREIEKKEEEMWRLRGELKEIAWGSQIRSYVLHPYSMIKDHRTGVEVGNTEAVLDGDIDMFIAGYLEMRAEAFQKELSTSR